MKGIEQMPNGAVIREQEKLREIRFNELWVDFMRPMGVISSWGTFC